MSEAAPRDPLLLLVAYADGELAADTTASIEARLADSADLRNQLEDVRALQAGLRTHLPAAPTVLDAAHRQAVLRAAKPLRIRRWVSIRWVAAACLALGMLGLWLSSSVSMVREGARSGRIIETLGQASGDADVMPLRTTAVSSLQTKGEAAALDVDEPGTNSLEAEGRSSDVMQPKGREEAVSDAIDGRVYEFESIGGVAAAAPIAESTSQQLPADFAAKAGDGLVLNELKVDHAQETGNAFAPAYDRRDEKPTGGSANLKQVASQLTATGTVSSTHVANGTVTSAVVLPQVSPQVPPLSPPPLQVLAARQQNKDEGGVTGQVTYRDVGQAVAKRVTKTMVDGKEGVVAPAVAQQAVAQQAVIQQAAARQMNKLPAKQRRLEPMRNVQLGKVQQQELLSESDHAIEQMDEGLEQPQQQDMAQQIPQELLQQNAQKLDQKTLNQKKPAQVEFQRVALDEATVTGQDMLLQARRAGQQLRILPDCLEVIPERRPLDPTLTFGMAKVEFQKAFHTVPMTATADTATLTFAFTADTASFDHAKSQLRGGQPMDPATIHAEHFVNAVPANYPPASGPEAFTLYAEAGPSPFAAGILTARTALVSVGAVARPAGAGERRPLALTLAIDCSGSMAQPDGLDRVRAGLGELLHQLGDADTVAVVAFDDRARVVLPATPGAEYERIAAAVAGLQASGSTNAGEGLSLAYQLAAESAKPGCESRVLLATDGATLAGDGAAPVLARIAADRARGITLIVVGCGSQQYQGNALEALAAQGDGQHVYLGSDEEARALFRDKLVPAKLGVLARDAKVQVTWNPQRVTHARLIGFENRRLSARDFRDDRVDAGELPHDSQATALFEVILADGGSGPLGTAAVRYLDTRLGTVRELACPLPGSLVRSHLSDRLRLMACSADLADLLGRTWWANQRCATYGSLLAELAHCAQSTFRDELRIMTEQAQRLTGEP